MAVCRRDRLYIWVTWLTRLLLGENSCEWAVWFRAQHESWSWDRVDRTFDTEGINESCQHWEDLGYAVFTENQNSFALRGNTATLGASRTSSPGRATPGPS